MTRVEATYLLNNLRSVAEGEEDEAIDMAIEALSAKPNKAVPPSLAEVYKWERDIALSQLEEYGICFGEKKRDDLVEVVRCKDCKWRQEDNICDLNCPIEYLGGTESDLWFYVKDEDYCSYGERREE